MEREEETIGPAVLGLKSLSASELFVTRCHSNKFGKRASARAPDSRQGRAVGEDGRFGPRFPLICLKRSAGEDDEHPPGRIIGC